MSKLMAVVERLQQELFRADAARLSAERCENTLICTHCRVKLCRGCSNRSCLAPTPPACPTSEEKALSSVPTADQPCAEDIAAGAVSCQRSPHAAERCAEIARGFAACRTGRFGVPCLQCSVAPARHADTGQRLVPCCEVVAAPRLDLSDVAAGKQRQPARKPREARRLLAFKFQRFKVLLTDFDATRQLTGSFQRRCRAVC